MYNDPSNELFANIKRPIYREFVMLVEYNAIVSDLQYVMTCHIRSGRCGFSRCRLIISVENAIVAKHIWIAIAKESNNLQPA